MTFLLTLSLFACALCAIAAEDNDERPANIIMIMMDDMGQSDIGLYGAEWETPNIDAFIKDSITLSHHYVGYVCSASRSQFLTGRYSFHSGFAKQYPFDRGELGGMPLAVPTIANYLKKYANYDTYAIGKWQLGTAIEEQLPNSRGFDMFYGFLGGFEDYYSKSTPIWSNDDDPMYIKKDDTEYLDFWLNKEPIDSTSNIYSTTLYANKMIEILGARMSQEPFFMYAGLQASHIPFSYESEFYTKCKDSYLSAIYGKNEIKTRDGVCEAMLGVDDAMGKLITFLKSDEMVNVWDDTIIIFTTDNGGSISEGGCNYPLRFVCFFVCLFAFFWYFFSFAFCIFFFLFGKNVSQTNTHTK